MMSKAERSVKDSLQNIKVVKAFSQHKTEQDKFIDQIHEYRKSGNKYMVSL